MGVFIIKTFAFFYLYTIIRPFLFYILLFMKKLPILQMTLVILLVGVMAFGFFMTKKKTNI